MGLLDDAIREHLELKRRRGADPSEIEREEAEALGPVRREERRSRGRRPSRRGRAEPTSRRRLDDDPARADAELTSRRRARAAGRADGRRRRPADPPATPTATSAEPEHESATPPHGDPLPSSRRASSRPTSSSEALGRARTHRAERAATSRRADDARGRATPRTCSRRPRTSSRRRRSTTASGSSRSPPQGLRLRRLSATPRG